MFKRLIGSIVNFSAKCNEKNTIFSIFYPRMSGNIGS